MTTNQRTLKFDFKPSESYLRGLDLFTESVLKPDVALRQCARNQECYEELMQIRSDVLEYLKTLR